MLNVLCGVKMIKNIDILISSHFLSSLSLLDLIYATGNSVVSLSQTWAKSNVKMCLLLNYGNAYLLTRIQSPQIFWCASWVQVQHSLKSIAKSALYSLQKWFECVLNTSGWHFLAFKCKACQGKRQRGTSIWPLTVLGFYPVKVALSFYLTLFACVFWLR